MRDVFMVCLMAGISVDAGGGWFERTGGGRGYIVLSQMSDVLLDEVGS